MTSSLGEITEGGDHVATDRASSAAAELLARREARKTARGKLLAVVPEPHREVTEVLASGLDLARSGEVMGVAVVLWERDGTYRVAHGGGPSAIEKLGALAMLQGQMIFQMKDV